MDFSLANLIQNFTTYRAIVTINIDYLDDSTTQLPECYLVRQDITRNLYYVFHQMGSRIVGLTYIGDNLQDAIKQTGRMIS